MADSQRLAIRKNVQAALQAMTVAGGYHWDVKASSVVRDPVALTILSVTEAPFFVVGEMEPLKREFHPALRVEDGWLLRIYGLIDTASADQDGKDDAAEHTLADLEKALNADIFRGGLAIDTRLHQPAITVIGLPSQPRVIVVQPVEIRTERQYGQP